jgi:hypothetical protein
MKNFVATAALAVVAGVLAAAISLVRVDSVPAAASASSYDMPLSVRAQVDQVATHFRGGGASFFLDAIDGKEAGGAAALEHAGVILTILGLAGFAVVVRIRLRAEGLVQLRIRSVSR